MPAYIREFTPHSKPELAGWIYRGKGTSVALYMSDIAVAKLLIVQCLEDNSRTVVFEKELPYDEQATSLEDEMIEFKASINKDTPSTIVEEGSKGVKFEIGDDDIGLGVIINHTEYGEPDSFKPRQVGALTQHLRTLISPADPNGT
jgi:hypothetical protein